MPFRVTGLSPEPFQPLFGLPDAELGRRGVTRRIVDCKPGYPDRIEMREVEPGETVLLLNYMHQPADTPYRATHAIFVREGATDTYAAIDRIPEVMRLRLLSLRAYDEAGWLLQGEVVDGTEVEPVIERLLADPAVSYIHVHNAKQGCYAGRIDRIA